MRKIVVIGNFDTNNKLGGQTVRTQTVFNSIKKKYNSYSVINVDTSKNKLLVFIKMIFLIIISKRVVILPAQRSLFPLLKIIRFFRIEKKVVYVVIGGWLFDLIKNSDKDKKTIGRFKAVLVQVNKLKEDLNKIGINNVDILLNYRIINSNIVVNQKKNNKVVFYSRVCKEKGIEIAIDAIKNIKNVELDIYGPIKSDYVDSFFNLINDKTNINYCGILENDEIIIKTLSLYNYMIFPTYYEGEGFPGAILESFIAGTPIIASDWKYNSDIIQNNITGIILEQNTASCLLKTLNQVWNDIELNKKMQKNCFIEAKKYEEVQAVKTLYRAIGL